MEFNFLLNKNKKKSSSKEEDLRRHKFDKLLPGCSCT
jgi:hypothetical protein